MPVRLPWLGGRRRQRPPHGRGHPVLPRSAAADVPRRRCRPAVLALARRSSGTWRRAAVAAVTPARGGRARSSAGFHAPCCAHQMCQRCACCLVCLLLEFAPPADAGWMTTRTGGGRQIVGNAFWAQKDCRKAGSSSPCRRFFRAAFFSCKDHTASLHLSSICSRRICAAPQSSSRTHGPAVASGIGGVGAPSLVAFYPSCWRAARRAKLPLRLSCQRS